SLCEHRTRKHRGRLGAADAGRPQSLRRQIETSERRILVEVAQNIGELQRPPQMVGKRNSILLSHSEDADRQTTDRARDSIAIKVERCLVGRPYVLDHVHFHSIDDGVEILAPKSELAYRRKKAVRARDRLGSVAGV